MRGYGCACQTAVPVNTHICHISALMSVISWDVEILVALKTLYVQSHFLYQHCVHIIHFLKERKNSYFVWLKVFFAMVLKEILSIVYYASIV